MNIIMMMILFAFVIQPVYAYLDPGSGSVLVSVLVALLAAAFYFLKNFIYEKAGFLFKKQNSLHKNHYSLVFYSEGGHYWSVFMPIIKELSVRGIGAAYFTSDPSDPGLSSGLDGIESHFIGEGKEAFFVLNRLSADVLVMTTPGLDVLQLKRSKKVGHYCHLVHGLEDTSTYPPYGVDYYDSVLVNGRHQEDVIRQLEAARDAKRKHIEIIGSTYLDVMAAKIKQLKQSTPVVGGPAAQTLLLAPSWGEKGVLGKYGETLLSILLKEGFNLILRPHPQSIKTEADLLRRLNDKFEGCGNLVWDYNPQGLESMLKADLMVSDFSGIIFDYIFLLKKPVVVTDFSVDPRKFDMNALPSKSSTLMGLIKDDKIGFRLSGVDDDNHKQMFELIQSALDPKSNVQYTRYIEELKATVWCHPGEAGKRGAAYLANLVNTISPLK